MVWQWNTGNGISVFSKLGLAIYIIRRENFFLVSVSFFLFFFFSFSLLMVAVAVADELNKKKVESKVTFKWRTTSSLKFESWLKVNFVFSLNIHFTICICLSWMKPAVPYCQVYNHLMIELPQVLHHNWS